MDMSQFEYVSKQVQRKNAKKGFDFSIIVVGESGLGKSTLIQSLFLTNMIPDRVVLPAHERITQTLKIESSTVEFEERGLKLRLTVIDTPGFADAIDSTGCIKPIYDYIERQFDNYFVDESGVNRRNIVDSRIHCCLYFIAPNGRGLKNIDISFMKTVQNRINIIPLIAKADAMTHSELLEMKKLILKDLAENHISIYDIPECDSEDDPEYVSICRDLKKSIPFAIIGSNRMVKLGKDEVRGREYPWGVINIDDSKHCDFSYLRTMLLRSHTQDLKDITEEINYENYRAERLTGEVSINIEAKIEEEKEQCCDTEMDNSICASEKEEEIKKIEEIFSSMRPAS